MRAKTIDQPGKVYKTVDHMTKRCTVRENQYLVPDTFNVREDAMYDSIGHFARWGLGMWPTNPHQSQNHTFLFCCLHTPSFQRGVHVLFTLFFPYLIFRMLLRAASRLIWLDVAGTYGMPQLCAIGARQTCFRRVFGAYL
jgi:hypothetical protein